MIEITVNPDSGVAIYQQIVQQLRGAILSRKSQLGEQMPSVRELSRLLNINPLTVAKAYGELEREGLVVSRWGKGNFVCDRLPPSANVTAARHLNELVDRFVREALPLVRNPPDLTALVQARLKTESRENGRLKNLSS